MLHGSSCVYSPALRTTFRVTAVSSMFGSHRRPTYPSNRPLSFFSHLVDTLGPADFLAPVTMLLVDRVANRVVRQNATESAGSLFLPLAVCERYPANLQLPVSICTFFTGCRRFTFLLAFYRACTRSGEADPA